MKKPSENEIPSIILEFKIIDVNGNLVTESIDYGYYLEWNRYNKTESNEILIDTINDMHTKYLNLVSDSHCTLIQKIIRSIRRQLNKRLWL